ncbi:hypothetical protein LOZ12_006544 [Ophidiomyces ophidiicola]|uniref:Uncharacterized protein n=1 Tax=Ophidiomyces ophidiicola TaxID=1387563 RepID=A0ACB8UQ88_9EURO|nr:uncharacterized protein LOZ57_001628 [Ophidiomyces ophidiicola]KAI1912177.1 hypothetical protein LOZ64_004481 [Ophidiomyces ophidiicola]KAI1932569.1 hypothetical protein LOZ62_006607 [Ophidiomyces ophidiicola]KAI1950701.1 hypothetical protein LOZ59_005782 [Ophidiomyces ophidiicola]KAI1951078.1 hypothetical protein LOZ57_001628 [Ophidiomyces ophidiicola]KAI2002582.1 hypothetical protein LOZ49_006265 [Ophidiomyces ophidiicola]
MEVVAMTEPENPGLIYSSDDDVPLAARRQSKTSILTERLPEKGNIKPTTDLTAQPFRSVVILRVGAKREEFFLHTHVFAGKSKWCLQRLGNLSSKTFDLDWLEADVFGDFANWLYHNILPSQESKSDDEYYSHLKDLYLLAEEFGVEGLAGDVVNRMFNFFSRANRKMSSSLVESIYKSTGPESKLRRLAAIMYAHGYVKGMVTLPEILNDVIIKQREDYQLLKEKNIENRAAAMVSKTQGRRKYGERATSAENIQEVFGLGTQSDTQPISKRTRASTEAPKPINSATLLSRFQTLRGK